MNNDQPSLAVILPVLLIGLLVAVTSAVYGASSLARRGVRQADLGLWLRACAALAVAATALMYVWGAVHLVRDETMTTQACRDAVPAAQAAHISGVDVSLVPLHLNCHVTGGGSYAAAVPEYVNPAVLGLALIAVVLGVFAALESERRARTDFKKEDIS
ncbi:hypothetical protein ACFV06_31765 [Streptomyces sp. NPDC059618]|uniref:hypothetical protein n=1 Tax=Streptomyces sp. NPDC059618 TaxID=3346887 RepID=UPI0036AFE885